MLERDEFLPGFRRPTGESAARFLDPVRMKRPAMSEFVYRDEA